MTPCRTTQHCTVHDFCSRCNPEITDKALRLLAVFRTQLDTAQTTEAYNALARILTGKEAERCIHNRAMHDKHHSFHSPASGCPWCTEKAEIR